MEEEENKVEVDLTQEGNAELQRTEQAYNEDEMSMEGVEE